jgi:hypothetical protein
MFMLFTESQQAARNILLLMGRTFFSGVQIIPDLKLRLYPLLIGPTGVGKSQIVKTAANRLGAYYLRICRGDWNVVGSRAGRPTTYQVLDYVATYPRVLLHIDELDKFTDLQSGDWSAAISGNLWSMLDGVHPVAEYLRDVTFTDKPAPTGEELEARIKNLWIVGSGTWQSVYKNSRAGSSIGFGRNSNDEKVGMEAIIASNLISSELLNRFNNDVVFLEYPSLAETRRLLDGSGITKLAKQLGARVEPESIDWTRGGMRSLETVATRLALAYHRRNPASLAKLETPQAAQPAVQHP